MSYHFLRHCFSFLFLFFTITLLAQDPSDLRELQVYIAEARSMGYSDDQILTLAKEKGAGENELAILKLQLREDQKIEEPSFNRQRVTGELIRARFSQDIGRGSIFGMELFSSENKISLQSTNAPTPSDYQLGPGDELFIDIYGASEKYYTAQVSPDGTISLSNIGPVYVSGLSIDQATKKIKGRLQSVYGDIGGASPTTFVSVALGNVRSISINIVGEVNAPGTYELGGLSTVFNALYVSGGPKESGSFREIRVFRENKLISTVDLYDFILNGQALSNIRLLGNEVILIPPYTQRVEISGEVKRPGIYELKSTESFSDLVRFSGGFTDQAYTAKVNVVRNTSTEKVVSDIFPEQFELFTVSAGDRYTVDRILDRFQNRVLIKGAVFRPGSYAITEGLSLSKLIERADGLRGDAFINRALITRSAADFSTKTITIDLQKVLNGENNDPVLLREDVIEILSIYDFKEERYVRISGEVNETGVFRFSEDMSVQDLIFRAKGLKKSAQEGTIEISRRPSTQSWENQMEVIRLSIDRELRIDGSAESVLQPFDHVIVRRNPTFFEERIIEMTGQVNFPGQYTLRFENERVSDVLERAGGLNKNGFPGGATLIRKTEFFASERQQRERQDNLLSVMNGIDSTYYSESDLFVIDRIVEELNSTGKSQNVDNSNLAANAKKERLEELAAKNVYLSDIRFKEAESIALNLEEILKNPNSPDDLILEDGDIINIPKELATVRMRGRVLYPSTVRFEESKSAKYYVNKAGGYDTRAKKSSTYVVYANGEVARTKNFLGIVTYPKVMAGSEVIVPTKPPKMPVKSGDVIAITTGLATLAALTVQTIVILRTN